MKADRPKGSALIIATTGTRGENAARTVQPVTAGETAQFNEFGLLVALYTQGPLPVVAFHSGRASASCQDDVRRNATSRN